MLQWRRQRRFLAVVNLGLVFLGPILVLATYLVLGPFERSASSNEIRLIVMADIIYVLVTVALVSKEYCGSFLKGGRNLLARVCILG